MAPLLMASTPAARKNPFTPIFGCRFQLPRSGRYFWPFLSRRSHRHEAAWRRIHSPHHDDHFAIIFCTVGSGIASMPDMKKVGRVGGKARLYFEVVSTLAPSSNSSSEILTSARTL